MTNRDFNNNVFNLSDVYNNQNITNATISLLPTTTVVNTLITNNNLNYTTTVGINTLLNSTVVSQTLLRDQAIATALTAYTTSLLTATLINNNIISNNLNYTTTTGVNTLITNNNNLMLSTVRNYTAIQNFNEITANKITLSTNYILSYTILPIFVSNQIGSVNTATRANVTVVSYDAILNVNSIVLTAGIYIINFSFKLSTNTATFPGPLEKGWLGVGLSSSINDLSFINKRMAFLTQNTTDFTISESFFIVANNTMTLFNNIQLLGYESSGLPTRFYINTQSISALRVG